MQTVDQMKALILEAGFVDIGKSQPAKNRNLSRLFANLAV